MAADTAQNALIQRVINGLVDVIVKECTHVYNFQSNVQNVQAKIEELKSVQVEVDRVVDAVSKGGKIAKETTMFWKGQVVEIADKSDKVLMCAEKVNRGFLKGRLNVPRRFLLSRKAAQLNEEIAKLLVKGQEHTKTDNGHVVPAGQLFAPIPSEDLESRMKLVEQVVAALMDDGIYMIGICGMTGVGKTRLADKVKEIVLKDKLFDAAVKVDVSKISNIQDIQGVLAHSFGLELKETDEDGRARRLFNRLTDGSKNLVILDHISDPVPLDSVGLPFHGVHKGCKVVFTSQNTRMPRLMKANVKVEVEPLSIHEARLLFKKIAGDSPAIVTSGEYDEKLVDNVADECGGLPLAIDAVASALGGKPSEVWESALVQLKGPTITNMRKLADSRIKLSYDLLGSSNPEAQPLLLLCCLFPEGADIPYQKLVRYAQGLQVPEASDNLANTSNRVFQLLDDLQNYSLLLRGEKEMTVKMNHVVRDVCLSISSEEDKNRFNVKHKPQLTEWPDKEQQPYTGISLTFGDQMQQLPDGLVYPKLALLQLQFHCDSLNMPEEFFNGMKEVRVLDFKRMTLWGKFIQIDALPPILKFLTNLRTLCIEFCDLSGGDLSLIEGLKNLEILSFFSSKLVNLPSQIQQLTNLKLLDLRCVDGPKFIPTNLLPALTKLEYLYLGNYDSWSRGQGQGVNITELSSLSLLKVVQVRVKDPRLLLELKEKSWFDNLRKFEIAAIRSKLSFYEYEIGRSITFDGMGWSSLKDAKIVSLLSTTECLTLKATRFRDLFGVCSNLQTLDLDGGDDVKFIMEAGDSAKALNHLKCMDIKSMDDLEAICSGDLPSNSLTNLETVKLDRLPKLKQLWGAPMGSECLGNLRVLEMSFCKAITCIFPFSVAKGLVCLERLDIKSCETLEWIVSEVEGGAAEKIVLQKLSFLSLDDLLSFRSFSPDSGVKTLTEISATVEEDSFVSAKAANHKTQGCWSFTRKERAPGTRESPGTKSLPPAVNDFKHEAPVRSEGNVECTTEPLFNQLVELPSMNKLLVGSMDNLEHIVNDQTSKVSVSKIRVMHVIKCEKVLSLAASEKSIRSLQSLEQVNVEKCDSMEAMFDFRRCNVENPSADPMLNKLETVTLQKLKNLKHVFWMVPEGTPCFTNLRSLEISGCESLSYVFSVSTAKMLENLQDLIIKGSAMVEEIIDIEGGDSEVTDTIKFSHLRVLKLHRLDRLTSFSSRNHDFEFPLLQDLFIRKCPNMNKFCGGQVKARKLDRVAVGEHPDERVFTKDDDLNITIRQLTGNRVALASAEIEEV